MELETNTSDKKTVTINNKKFPLVESFSVKWDEASLRNEKEPCLFTTTQIEVNYNILSTKACGTEEAINYLYDFEKQKTFYDESKIKFKAQIKLISKVINKDIDLLSKAIPNIYIKDFDFDKNVKFCFSMKSSPLIYMKLCFSKIEDNTFSEARERIGCERITEFNCINNEIGKEICYKFLGECPDSEGNLVDHFDY